MFEDWLFVEGVTYREAQDRALRLWNVKGSVVSVGRFYRRIERDRMLGDMAEALETSDEVNVSEAKAEGMSKAGMKVLAMMFLEKAMARGDVRDLVALGRLISQNEEREIQRGRLELARERFQFNAAREAMKHLPLANKFKQEEHAREEARVKLMTEAIFGREALTNDECRMTNDGLRRTPKSTRVDEEEHRKIHVRG
jgi:hypothetical protein